MTTTADTHWKRVVTPGWFTEPWYGDGERPIRLFIEIEYRFDMNQKWELSITGVEGPIRNGDAVGSCGQMRDHLTVTAFSPGWDADMVLRLADIWERWHLNGMRAGCEHQRAEGWDKRPIDPSKPTATYGKHFDGQRSASWNLLGWVRPDEHPDGLMTKPCPVCGYKYGTAWLHEPVPADVLQWLYDLPKADREHPWGDCDRLLDEVSP